MHNKILDLFNYKIETEFVKSIPEIVSEIHISGKLVKTFSNKFPDKVYHVFNTIKLEDFGEFTNIILISNQLNSFQAYQYKKLINDLFELYGPTELTGKYTSKDFRDLFNFEHDYHQLRTWPGVEDYLLPCVLDVHKAEKSVHLTIYGAKLSPDVKMDLRNS